MHAKMRGLVEVTTYHLALFVLVTALLAMAYEFMISGKGKEAVNNLGNLGKIFYAVKEECVGLNLEGADREAGDKDVYDASNTPGLGKVPLKDAYAYALYLYPATGGMPWSGTWYLQKWSVTCEGLEFGKPKTHIIVVRDYAEIYPRGYLPVLYKSQSTRALIDMSESEYEAIWSCPDSVKVTVVTADASGEIGEGTDENVDLCYYVKK